MSDPATAEGLIEPLRSQPRGGSLKPFLTRFAMLLPAFNPRVWSREAARALCRASLDSYEDDHEGGELVSAESTDTQAMIFSNESDCILAFRGTSSAEDAKTDARATRTDWNGYAAHYGFVNAYFSIRPKIISALTPRLSHGQRLHFPGHSLGGALATLAGWDLAHTGNPGGIYTFGSPRVFGRSSSKRADEIFSGRYFRVVNSNDIIPRIPRLFRRNLGWLPGWFPWMPTTRPLRHCGRHVLLTEDGFALHKPGRARVMLERIIGFRADLARDHFLAAYLGALS